MKRNEQNKAMKEKILQSALEEFSVNSYEKASMNRICSNGHISKGIIYHYFKDKDDLYLECVENCYQKMMDYYNLHGLNDMKQLNDYMILRMHFFEENPLYQNLFFQILLNSPDHLLEKIQVMKNQLDKMNLVFYKNFLSQFQLRKQVSLDTAIEFIDLVQNAYNQFFKQALSSGEDFHVVVEKHEKMIPEWIDMMLYGIIKEE